MKMNEALLDIMCYVRDSKRYVFSDARIHGLEKSENEVEVDVYGTVRDMFFAIPREVFRKAQIRCCMGNYDRIWYAVTTPASMSEVTLWEAMEPVQLSRQEVGDYIPYKDE